MIERKNGVTVIVLDGALYITNKINRYRFNDLRKMNPLSEKDVLKVIELSEN